MMWNGGLPIVNKKSNRTTHNDSRSVEQQHQREPKKVENKIESTIEKPLETTVESSLETLPQISEIPQIALDDNDMQQEEGLMNLIRNTEKYIKYQKPARGSLTESFNTCIDEGKEKNYVIKSNFSENGKKEPNKDSEKYHRNKDLEEYDRDKPKKILKSKSSSEDDLTESVDSSDFNNKQKDEEPDFIDKNINTLLEESEILKQELKVLKEEKEQAIKDNADNIEELNRVYNELSDKHKAVVIKLDNLQSKLKEALDNSKKTYTELKKDIDELLDFSKIFKRFGSYIFEHFFNLTGITFSLGAGYIAYTIIRTLMSTTTPINVTPIINNYLGSSNNVPSNNTSNNTLALNNVSDITIANLAELTLGVFRGLKAILKDFLIEIYEKGKK